MKQNSFELDTQVTGVPSAMTFLPEQMCLSIVAELVRHFAITNCRSKSSSYPDYHSPSFGEALFGRGKIVRFPLRRRVSTHDSVVPNNGLKKKSMRLELRSQ